MKKKCISVNLFKALYCVIIIARSSDKYKKWSKPNTSFTDNTSGTNKRQTPMQHVLAISPPTAHEYNINKVRHMKVRKARLSNIYFICKWYPDLLNKRSAFLLLPPPLLPKQKSAAATLWWTEKNIIRRDESRNKNKQSESDIGANPGLVPIHQVGIRACMILIWFAALFEEVLIQEINNYQLNLGARDNL